MFTAEAKGLDLLKQTQTVAVPKVIEVGACDDLAFLLMEYIEPDVASQSTQLEMGRQLALLHKQTTGLFGLATDNYIGSLKQYNNPLPSWAVFFTQMRLQPQVEIALSKGLLSNKDAADFEKLYAKLGSLFPVEKPSLLHGDLWSGNYLVGPNGKPFFIDPAVYYGYREMDIAMTKLFGGFSSDFYNAYNDNYPLQSGWQQRVDLCNLYPLLVHVNLFGGSYVEQVRQLLKLHL